MKKKDKNNKTKKNKSIFIIIIIVITIIRFLISFNLPSFIISNLNYDDKLMTDQMISLLSGNYLGDYNDTTLIKGIIFPLLLTLCRIIHINYSTIFTCLYILAVLYFVKPFEKLIKNKYILLIFYVLILFNPISYSSELFQRLYRNSISIIELLFFLGTTIRIIISADKTKKSVINYIILGIITSIMYLTREDNIWTKLILVFIIIYKYLKYKNIKKDKYKKILITLIPFIVLTINLNIVSMINYNYYKVYTYNEIQKSEFKKTFRKILQIKDDEKKDKVSIPKTTMYKLNRSIPSLNVTKRRINQYYKVLSDNTGEIYNGNIIWYFREMTYKENNFKNGKEAAEYYKKVGYEIDYAFSDGRFKKEFAFQSILLNMPTKNEVINMPKNLINIVLYTTSYKNVKTICKFQEEKYDNQIKAYKVINYDSHTTENIVKKNDSRYEILRVIYKILVIILSPISIIIYILNIKKKDIFNLLTTIILFIYLIILAGVTYTDATAFPTMRYLCLGNLYILQIIFILFNIYRLYNYKYEINKK